MLQSPYVQLTIDITVGFFALLTISRLIRKTQIRQVTPFDFISAIVLGELLGNAIYDPEASILNVVYAMGLWASLMYIMTKITQKKRRSRKLIEGEPAILIRNGVIDFNVIKREKININEVMTLLRQKDVFSIREVEYGILEQNGDISVLKKSKYDNPTNEDMKLPEKQVYLPINVILDGEVLTDNLKGIGFDDDWLIKQLHKHGIKKIKDVFLAEYKKDEGLHVVTRKGNLS